MKKWGWGFLVITLTLTSRAHATFHYYNYTDPYGVSGQYKLEVPPDATPESPKGILVYLHGDGAGDFDRNDHWGTMTALAKQNGLMLLSVRSPASPKSECGAANALCWWVNAARNGRYLDSVLKSIESRYGMDKSRTLFSGQSGGSTFLAGEFLPKYGKEYGGGALLACNGMLNSLNRGINNGPDPENFRVDILTSEKDFLKGGAEGVYHSYKRHGFKNLSYFSEPIKFRRTNRGLVEQISGNHCQFESGFGSWLTRTANAVFADKKKNSGTEVASRESRRDSLLQWPEVSPRQTNGPLPPTSPYFVSRDLLPEQMLQETSTHADRPASSSEVGLRKREVASSRPVATPLPATRRAFSAASPALQGFRPFRALFSRFRR